jgi:hypothetical protein
MAEHAVDMPSERSSSENEPNAEGTLDQAFTASSMVARSSRRGTQSSMYSTDTKRRKKQTTWSSGSPSPPRPARKKEHTTHVADSPFSHATTAGQEEHLDSNSWRQSKLLGPLFVELPVVDLPAASGSDHRSITRKQIRPGQLQIPVRDQRAHSGHSARRRRDPPRNLLYRPTPKTSSGAILSPTLAELLAIPIERRLGRPGHRRRTLKVGEAVERRGQ